MLDVGSVERGDGGTAEKAKRALDIVAQDFNRTGYAGLAGGGETVDVGAADEDGAGAKTEGFDDVAAAADAAVDQNFGVAADGGDDFWKGMKRGGDRIELPAAMIGDHDGGCAGINTAPCIFAGEHALDHDRTGPHLANPAEVVPGDGGTAESGGDVDEFHGALAGDDDVFEFGNAAIEKEIRDPGGMSEELPRVGNFFEERAAEEGFHAVAVVAFAHAGDG